MSKLVTTPCRRASRIWTVAAVLGCLIAMITWYLLRPNAEQLLERGVAAMRQDPAVSERWLRQAIALRSGRFPDAEIVLCRLLLRRNAWQEAESLFNGIDITSCQSEQLLAFGREALPTRLRSSGLAALESVGARAGHDSVAALEILAADYQLWGQRELMIGTVRRLTHLEPDSPKYRAVLIEHLMSSGRESECLEATRDALRSEFPVDQRRALQNSLVQQLIDQGDAPAARREWNVFRNLEGESIRLRGQEAYLCRLEGRLEQAVQIATRITDEAPELTFAHFTRGIVLLDLRRFEEAATELERTVAAQPFNPQARFKLSEAYRGLRRDEQAAEHRKLASDIVEKQKRISSLLKLREEGRHDEQLYRELQQLSHDLGDEATANVWARWVNRMIKNESAK